MVHASRWVFRRLPWEAPVKCDFQGLSIAISLNKNKEIFKVDKTISV